MRDGLRSSRNGLRENANERRESFLQLWNSPTQAKGRLEWATRGLQLRSDDATCSTHMAIDLNASAAMGGSVGDWHVDQYNWQASPWGTLGHLEEVVTGGPIVTGAMASGVACSK